MAVETPNPFTWTAISATGLKQYTLVSLTTAAKWAKASTGGGLGNKAVLLESSTGSTEDRPKAAALPGPVVKVRVSTASTAIAPGNLVTNHTDGFICPTSAGDNALGWAMENVGATGTAISVCFHIIGTT